MSRAGPSSSNRNRRVVRPIMDDGDGVYRSVMKTNNMTIKQLRALPQTISASTCSSSGNSGCKSNSSRVRTSATSSRNRTSCPVIGFHSNVSDDYVIFPTVIGEGHYGKVRECIHRRTRLTYACKSIDKSKIGRLDHLQREVHLLSAMNHHGIMKMVDCYEDAEYVHIVTEKYTGGELYETIIGNTTSSGCLSEQKTSSIIKSLLEAVAYLHDNDIVHRDIKPDNILFESDQGDMIKLIDFGLSRRHKNGDAPMSNPVGTAFYMSPELLRGKYNRSCDIWAVGIIAYILLCGYPPYNGDTDQDIFESIQRGELNFPTHRGWSTKSSAAKDFIKSLLCMDHKRRLTAEEALDHPWIAGMSNQCDRSVAKGDSTVARIQQLKCSINRFKHGAKLHR